MARAPTSPFEAEIAAALDWWREAGVDAAYTDETIPWLGEPKAEGAAVVAPKPKASLPEQPEQSEPPLGGPSVGWPTGLAEFHDWWRTEPSLDEGGLAPRVPASGDAGAEVMLLVAMPEASDSDRLLSGPQGNLADAFLRAAGLAPGQIYKAAVLPRHTPFADWEMLERQGISELLAHHVGLVRPKRIIAFGRIIPPLCGHDPAQQSDSSTFFNHEGLRVPVLFEAELDRLLKNAQSRARFWKRWLDFTDGQTWDTSRS